VIPETIVIDAVSAIRSGGAIGGGARVRLEPVAPLWARVMFSIGSWIYFRYHFAAGCFVFVRRDVFDKIGGFDETYFATEEVHLSRSLRRLGRFVILADAVVTSHRKFDLVSPGRFFGELLRAIRNPDSVIRKRHWWWYGNQREQTPKSRLRKH
jgi:GT2 family glycosyltransferase